MIYLAVEACKECYHFDCSEMDFQIIKEGERVVQVFRCTHTPRARRMIYPGSFETYLARNSRKSRRRKR